jgi:hypothetical protein
MSIIINELRSLNRRIYVMNRTISDSIDLYDQYVVGALQRTRLKLLQKREWLLQCLKGGYFED